jgi:hypothetical protein
MKRLLPLLTVAITTTFLFSSCMKEEKPYPVPEPPKSEGEFKVLNSQVKMGEDYGTQIYFSFTTGQAYTSSVKSWDVSFTTGADDNEMWMNSGKPVLIYPTGNTNYAAIITKGGIATNAWKYDSPSGLTGKSGLGILSNQNHVGEVLIVDGGENIYFKLQILEVTATQYKIKAGPLEATTGSEYTLTKDDNYNFIYFSFNNGIVTPEPPKKDWDILFTRYRTVYYKYNPDGSDFPYPVNGVLTNPYKTQSAGDSTKSYEFYPFSLENANAFTLRSDRDVIGYNWKSVNINTGQYTVKPKSIYLVKDQNDALWKLHFVNFYDSEGKKGSPQFEYQRLK